MDKSDLTPEQLIKFEILRDCCKQIMQKDLDVIKHLGEESCEQPDEESLNGYIESFIFKFYKDFSKISISDVEHIYLEIQKSNAIYQVMISLHFKKSFVEITGDEEMPNGAIRAFFEKANSDPVIRRFTAEIMRLKIKIINLCRKIDDLDKENQALKYNQRVGGVNGA